MKELKAVRKTSILLFKSYDQETLQNIGFSWKYEISVLAMGFNLVGHQNHHLRVIQEHYSGLVL